ncbi:MAG: hypothetical protein MZV70_61110 [Desulfobacterales bacterium]|nr:hypothetical protein [Desulfobacterales bacterium]
MVAGVSFAEIGGLRINEKVAKDFGDNRFDPTYDYYYMNLENNPCAMIGLKKDYTVHDIPMEKDPLSSNYEFKRIIMLVKSFPMANSPTFGAYVWTQGKTIGVYYSSAGVGVAVDKEDKTVSLSMFMGGDKHN